MADDKFSFPWEHSARRGDEMPEGLSLPDQMAYTAMRNVYWSFSRKIINRDAAAAEKQRIRREYEQRKTEWDFWVELAKHQYSVNMATEAAKTACRKDPTPENVNFLIDVMDGIKKVRNME